MPGILGKVSNTPGADPLAAIDASFGALSGHGKPPNQARYWLLLDAELPHIPAHQPSALADAYARAGEDAISGLRGGFALAIWDSAEKTLLLARDPLGIKPLYFTTSPQYLAFCDEVLPLVKAGLAENSLSRRAIATFISLGAILEPDTLFNGVSPIPPGTILEYRNGKVRQRTFAAPPFPWDPHPSPEPPLLQQSLEDAVSIRLGSEHQSKHQPTGILSNKTLADTLVSALATRITSNRDAPIPLLSAPSAATVPNFYSLNSFQRAIDAMDQPSAFFLESFHLAKAAREAGLSLALSSLAGGLAGGLAADLVFPGSPLFSSFALRLQARRSANCALGTGTPLEHAYFLHCTGTPHDPTATLVSPDIADDAILPFHIPEKLEPLLARRAIHPDDALAILEIENRLRNITLRDIHAAARYHRVSFRAPLLDLPLLQHVFRLSAPKIPLLAANRLLACAHSLRLPPPLLRQLRPPSFAAPPPFHLSLRPLFEDLLLGPNLLRFPFLNAPAIRNLYYDFSRNPATPPAPFKNPQNSTARRLFALTVLVAYLQKHEFTL